VKSTEQRTIGNKIQRYTRNTRSKQMYRPDRSRR